MDSLRGSAPPPVCRKSVADGPRAVTRVWHDNAASLGVARSLPYSAAGVTEELRRDRPDTMLSFSMARSQWETVRRTDIELTGTEAVRQFLAM